MNIKENVNSILRAVGLKAEELKLEQMKLDDGVTVIEAEMFEAGQPVAIVAEDGQLIPLPIGEYKLEDGRVLVVVEEGMISEVKAEDVEEEIPAEPPAEVPVAANDAPTATPTEAKVKSIVESIVKETKFSQEVEDLKAEIEALKTELSALKPSEETQEEVVELAEEPVKPIQHNPEPKGEVKMNLHSEGKSAKSRITNFLNNK